MRSIADKAAASSSSYRFALVSYGGRSPDDSDGESARTDVDFTADPAAIESGLDSLESMALEGGDAGHAGAVGDSSAPAYSGVMQAVGLNWRSEARKEVIVVGTPRPMTPSPPPDTPPPR